jgi:hypothetical protein
MSSNPLPLPSYEPLIVKKDRSRYPNPKDVDPREGFMAQRWQEYFDRQAQAQADASVRESAVRLFDQSASIAATDMSDSALASGTYEVLIFATVTQAPGVSYSLQVDIDFVYRSVSKKALGTAMTTPNTVAASLCVVVPILVDNASPVRYTVTYVSVGAPVMKYDLNLILRRVSA